MNIYKRTRLNKNMTKLEASKYYGITYSLYKKLEKGEDIMSLFGKTIATQ